MTEEGALHAAIIRHVVERGFAPPLTFLQEQLGWSKGVVEDVLERLAGIRGIILKPNSFDVWGIHPFTLMPTPTWVEAKAGAWWANCAWCALGIGAALRQDVRIISRLGAEGKTIEFDVRGGRSSDDGLLMHFPFGPREWWNNPYNPCGGILFFSSSLEVDDWCRRHALPRGEIMDIATGIALARAWFADYLNPEWRRKSPEEAASIFQSLGLSGDFWMGPAR